MVAGRTNLGDVTDPAIVLQDGSHLACESMHPNVDCERYYILQPNQFTASDVGICYTIFDGLNATTGEYTVPVCFTTWLTCNVPRMPPPPPSLPQPPLLPPSHPPPPSPLTPCVDTGLTYNGDAWDCTPVERADSDPVHLWCDFPEFHWACQKSCGWCPTQTPTAGSADAELSTHDWFACVCDVEPPSAPPLLPPPPAPPPPSTGWITVVAAVSGGVVVILAAVGVVVGMAGGGEGADGGVAAVAGTKATERRLLLQGIATA